MSEKIKNFKVSSSKSHMEWSWILMIAFFIMSIVDTRFGIGALLCMISPIYHSLKGRGRINCSHYCPRGSFLGKWLEGVSLKNTPPRMITKRWFKNLIIFIITAMLIIGIAISDKSLSSIGFVFIKLIFASTAISIILGVMYKPRSWCAICPMGVVSGDIASYKRRK